MFYSKIALNSIKVNKKLYVPYIIAGSLWIMMFYIILSLSFSPSIQNSIGGPSLIMILQMGVPFIFIFSAIFMFYTNSFLSKMRNKEYALYNVLGMNKKNIARILLWDGAITFASSLSLGLFCGILLYKFFEILLLRITQDAVNYTLSVNLDTVIITGFAFFFVFLFIQSASLIKIRIQSPIELLKSQNLGEKPPRANPFLGLLGIVCLAIAYYISISAKNPMQAMQLFFVAVMLVVAGTYLLFIAGSVLLCKILQNNKEYYYKADHFISVSSMAYRMKRTGAGLAAICIFCTMVLVMLSSTFSLYLGNEDLMQKRFPMDINMLFSSDEGVVMPEEFVDDVALFAEDVTQSHGSSVEDALAYKRLVTSGQIQDGRVELDYSNSTSYDAIYQIFFFDLAEYNLNMGTDLTLSENEIYVYSPREEFTDEGINMLGVTFPVKGMLDDFWSDSLSAMTIFSTLMIVVEDLSGIERLFDGVTSASGYSLLKSQFSYNYNTDLSGSQQVLLSEGLQDEFTITLGHYTHLNTFGVESKENNRVGFYGLFGGLLFIGLILSILFISATVLIIYYKQIVEGYEDRPRFEIMHKVGITKKEVRQSVNSQMLTVFFLPLVMAGIHLCFAFPIIKLFLLMFNLTNTMLFVTVSILGFVVFAIFYTIIYKVTSKLYFNIVSGISISP